MIQKFSNLIRALKAPTDNTLRQGVVDSYSGSVLGVKWGGSSTASAHQRHISSFVPVVGDTVWGIGDGDIKLVIGKIQDSNVASPATLIAFARAAASTAGVAVGRYANGLGGGVTSQTVGTSQTGLNLGVQSVPVTPGHLLRVRFKFAAAGPVNTSNEWYFYNMIAENGGAYAIKGEMRFAAAGPNAPSPAGEDLYVVPPGVTTISCGIDCKVLSTTGTPTVFRYDGLAELFHSFMTIEDLGVAS